MVGLGTVGTLSYNGYSFDGSSRLEVQSEFIQDDAQRTVVAVKKTLTVRAVIAATPTDASLINIRHRLEKQGQALDFRNRGFGDDVRVNVDGGVKDIAWGPKPKILDWVPLGANNACEIVWQCETTVPPMCSPNGLLSASGIMAFNYSVDFQVNDKGYTTRTITGYLQIAQTRNGRAVPDCADLYRSLIQPPLPADFKRSHDYKISADKSRLDFTIIDRQIESATPFPPGVVDIRANHRAHWQRRPNAMRIRNTISASIEMARNYEKSQALKIFLDMAFRRIAEAKTVNQAGVLIDNFEIDEELFSQKNSFSMSYRVMKNIGELLGTNGLGLGFWQPVVETNWQQWKLSMAEAFSQRGFANLGLQPGNDLIIDLCGGGYIPWWDESPRTPTIIAAATRQVANELPPPQSSWLDYIQQIIPYRSINTVRQAFMQPPDNTQNVENMNAVNGFGYPTAGGQNDIIQLSGRPHYAVALAGKARRVGYPVPRPAIIAAGGQVPIETETIFREWSEGNHFGITVYGAEWLVSYMLPNSPGAVPPKSQLQNGVA
jgi:hypothetical protein